MLQRLSRIRRQPVAALGGEGGLWFDQRLKKLKEEFCASRN